MKLTSPHLPTLRDPTIVEVGEAIDHLAELKQENADLDECFVLIEADDDTGAFVQAIAVDDQPRWQVEVCNADEAALRALREPTTRGRAVELLGRFVQGDRSLGNGEEWLDVDLDASGRAFTPTGFILAVLAILVGAVALWYYSNRA